MNQKMKNLAALMTVMFAILSAVGLFAASGRPIVPDVMAQGNEAAIVAPRTITVVGEGKVRIKPNVARATIGVEVVKASVREASLENKLTIENVVAVLKEQGVDEKDIQTSGFGIWAERTGGLSAADESDTRYHVANSVIVVIREIGNVGALLDGAIEAGANNMYGIEFRLEDPGSVEGTARQAAIADARAKAEELALLTDVSLGEVVSVSEIIGAGGGFYAGGFSEAAGYGDAPVSPGELSLTTQLQVTYAILN